MYCIKLPKCVKNLLTLSKLTQGRKTIPAHFVPKITDILWACYGSRVCVCVCVQAVPIIRVKIQDFIKHPCLGSTRLNSVHVTM